MSYFFNSFISPTSNLNESLNKDISKKLYTTKEAAKELGVSEYTIRKKIRDGELKAEKISGESGYRITRGEIERFSEKTGKSGIVLKKASPVSSVVACTANTPGVNPIIGRFIGSLIGLFQKKDDDLEVSDNLTERIEKNKDELRFLEAYKVGRQKDLNFAELNLQRLLLDEKELGNTKDFKKKHIELKMEIEYISGDLDAVNLRIIKLEKENEELMKKE